MKLKALVLIAASLIGGFAYSQEIKPNYDGPEIPEQPLTAVVITQCNGLVVAMITTHDGRLIAFDKTSGLPASDVLVLAAKAKISQRVEVACNRVST